MSTFWTPPRVAGGLGLFGAGATLLVFLIALFTTTHSEASALSSSESLWVAIPLSLWTDFILVTWVGTVAISGYSVWSANLPPIGVFIALMLHAGAGTVLELIEVTIEFLVGKGAPSVPSTVITVLYIGGQGILLYAIWDLQREHNAQ